MSIYPGTENAEQEAIQLTDKEKKQCRVVCCTSILFALSVIIIPSTVASSFHYVNYDEYAFSHYVYGSVDTSTVLTQGRYFYPLTYKSIKFPSTFQKVEFVSSVFADTGLEFDVHVVFYYRLPKNKLADIYNKYSSNYLTRILTNAKSAIKNTATQFTVNHYLMNRTYIENEFARVVSDELEDKIGVDVPVDYFKIRGIRFPDPIITSSLQSVVALQNNQVQQNQQAVNIVTSDTAQMVAEINARTTLIMAFADNQASKIVSDSESEANKIIISARGNGIKTTLDVLNITDQNARDEFIRMMSIIDTGDAKIMYGLDKAIINI